MTTAPEPNGTIFAQLAVKVTEAQKDLVDAERAESCARSHAVSARNTLNRAQRDFDEAVAKFKKSAPYNTSWEQAKP